MRIACVVEYDGAGFQGWQRQATGRTVQEQVEGALSRVADRPVTVTCAGRTDAGVHALGQVVHFDTAAERPDRAWLMGTNNHLPGDVAIRWSGRVDETFNARHSAQLRHYRYLIDEGAARPALRRNRVCWSARTLDEAAMRSAAHACLGERDFSAFRAAGCQSTTPMRRLDAVTVERRRSHLIVDVTGNAFLHNMVRILVGTLMAVGRGEETPAGVERIVASRDRRKAGPTAPAGGLYFLGATYPPDWGIPTLRMDSDVHRADRDCAC